MKNRYSTLLLSSLWIFMLLIIFKSLNVKLYDPDLWWHLSAGRELVENGVFLKTDIFSHTLQGTEWINFEWLGQWVMYLLMKGAGPEGLYWSKIIISLAVILLLGGGARLMGLRGPWLLVITWFGFKILQPRLLERVELATFLFLPLFIGAFIRAKDLSPKTRTILMGVLFGLMVLWVNLHAGFIYGIGILVLINVGARWAHEKKEYIHFLDRTLILLLGAMFINPFGPKITYVFVDHLVHLPQVGSLIQEWSTPHVKDTLYFWVLFISSAALLVSGIIKKWNAVYLWIPVILIFGLWGTKLYRNAALFAFVAIPFLAQGLLQLKRKNWTRIAWILCFLPLLSSATIAHSIPQEKVMWYRFPVGLCQFVKDQGITGTMYNTYGFGGYIQWELGPEQKVMMDGRYIFHPFVSQVYRWYRGIMNNQIQNRWETYLENRHVDYALTGYYKFPAGDEKTFHDVVFPRKIWALVYWDDTGLVYLKRLPKFAALIDTYEYHSINPANEAQTQKMRVRDLQKELSRHKKEVEFSVIRNSLENMVKMRTQ